MSKQFQSTITKTLVIVESPAKCGKIESYLGPGYKCVASFGHLREINSLDAIDVSNNFQTKYTIIDNPQKTRQVELLRKEIALADEVILATDDDREGEAIAWHICMLFDLPVQTTKRIIFHEITETAIRNAVASPKTIDMNVVNAQQSRQILDLLVGFTISPVLWKYISRTAEHSLSAGRCQTPALRIVYDNYVEIKATPGKPCYDTKGYFTNMSLPFELDKDYETKEEVESFLENSVNHDHVFTCSQPESTVKQPPEPFTTSKLQQAVSNELHISPKETMKHCQKLYEAGYITYMRTDSKKYSKDFIDSTVKYISANYADMGASLDQFLNPKLSSLQTNYKEEASKEEELREDVETSVIKKKIVKKESVKKVLTTKTKTSSKQKVAAQEAHEAIRPTNVQLKDIPETCETKERRIYKIIWENSVESCMAPAKYNKISARIQGFDATVFKYFCEQIVFPGWQLVKNKYEKAAKEYKYLLALAQNSVLEYKKMTALFKLTNIKSHYTEAKLVQLLEEKGIGRPSTFSMLIDKIQERGYVKKEEVKGQTMECIDFVLENDELVEAKTTRIFGHENAKLVIQPTGIMVIEFLIKYYNDIFNYDYTKEMEDSLDEIAQNKKIWHTLCETAFASMRSLTDKLKEEKKEEKQEIVIDASHSYMIAKYGPVIKCTNAEKVVSFLPVKTDIDLEKLKSGGYKLEEIIESPKTTDILLGKYNGHDLHLKKGKFGLYVTWGENSKSLSFHFGNRPIENVTYLEVMTILDKDGYLSKDGDNDKQSGERQISKTTCIKKGKYGDYIYHKTAKMKKPEFFKLKGFPEDYKTCDIEVLKSWIKEKYNVE